MCVAAYPPTHLHMRRVQAGMTKTAAAKATLQDINPDVEFEGGSLNKEGETDAWLLSLQTSGLLEEFHLHPALG